MTLRRVQATLISLCPRQSPSNTCNSWKMMKILCRHKNIAIANTYITEERGAAHLPRRGVCGVRRADTIVCTTLMGGRGYCRARPPPPLSPVHPRTCKCTRRARSRRPPRAAARHNSRGPHCCRIRRQAGCSSSTLVQERAGRGGEGRRWAVECGDFKTADRGLGFARGVVYVVCTGYGVPVSPDVRTETA